MNRRIGASCGAVLLLAGCTVPSSQGQRGFSGTTPLVINDNPYPDYKDEMNQIGIEYDADLSFNDPNRVSDDVANCYKEKGSHAFLGNYRVQQIRYCLALDYAAFKDNQIATHNYRTSGNPYFDKEATLQRWDHWGPEAGFTNAESLFQYMRGTYAFVKPTQMNITNSLRGKRIVLPSGGNRPAP